VTKAKAGLLTGIGCSRHFANLRFSCALEALDCAVHFCEDELGRMMGVGGDRGLSI